MGDLVSVVVPIYNVEKYLSKCIETIINQTYNNIEIILVNDGSTDNCLQICNDFREKDRRIKVINKKNGGLSDARNTGLKDAHGKYICFIDSDDYISNKYVEELYNLIIENNAQIALCNYEKVDEENKSISKEDIESQTISGKTALEKFNETAFYPASVVAWNKLYDINLFRNIIYPEGKIHEDEFTTYKLFYLAKKVAITSKVLYYYRFVPTSIMNRKFNVKRLDKLEALEQRVNFFRDNKEEKLYRLALIDYQYLLVSHYLKCKKYLENSKKIQKEILKKIRKNYNVVIKFKECSIKSKIKFTIVYIHPILYYNLKKLVELIKILKRKLFSSKKR